MNVVFDDLRGVPRIEEVLTGPAIEDVNDAVTFQDSERRPESSARL